jgi:hypothetical protein
VQFNPFTASTNTVTAAATSATEVLNQVRPYTYCKKGFIFVRLKKYLMFVDPCIVVQFLQCKTQQDATVYQNFIIPYFKWSSTYFGRHTAHHQEPKTAQAAFGFAYVEGCWTCSCWTLSDSVRYLTTPNNCTSNVRFTYAKPEAACVVLGSWWWSVCSPKHVELHLK